MELISTGRFAMLASVIIKRHTNEALRQLSKYRVDARRKLQVAQAMIDEAIKDRREQAFIEATEMAKEAAGLAGEFERLAYELAAQCGYTLVP